VLPPCPLLVHSPPPLSQSLDLTSIVTLTTSHTCRVTQSWSEVLQVQVLHAATTLSILQSTDWSYYYSWTT
jgi:hypothetical protein